MNLRPCFRRKVEAAGIEPPSFKSVRHNKFFGCIDLSLSPRVHAISTQPICSDFVARRSRSYAWVTSGNCDGTVQKGISPLDLYSLLATLQDE